LQLIGQEIGKVMEEASNERNRIQAMAI